jgi:hypothetical protein
MGIGYTIAFAATSPNVIICADKKTGTLRYSAICKSTETLLALNTKGDVGAQGPAGLKGDTGAQGPAGIKGDTGSAALEQDYLKVLDWSSTYTDGSNNYRTGDPCGDGVILNSDTNAPDGFCMITVPTGFRAFVAATLGSTANSSTEVIAFSASCASLTLTDWKASVTRNPTVNPNAEHLILNGNRDFANNRTHGIPLNVLTNGGCVGVRTKGSQPTMMSITKP